MSKLNVTARSSGGKRSWVVFDKTPGAKLGTISQFYKNIGTTKYPHWRVWYCLSDDKSVHADTRSCLAVYLAGGLNYKMESV